MSSVHFSEDELKEIVVKAINKYLDNKDEIIGNLEELKVRLYSVDELERKRKINNSDF